MLTVVREICPKPLVSMPACCSAEATYSREMFLVLFLRPPNMGKQGIRGVRAHLMLPRLGPRAPALECGYLAVPPVSVRFSPRECGNFPSAGAGAVAGAVAVVAGAGDSAAAAVAAAAGDSAVSVFRIAVSMGPTSVTSRSDSPSKSSSTLPPP